MLRLIDLFWTRSRILVVLLIFIVSPQCLGGLKLTLKTSVLWVIHSLFLMSSAKVTRSLFFKFWHLLTGAKWFLCTQSFWKNNIKLSFLRCPALRRIPLSQSHHQIEFPSYCKWLSNPSSLKDPLPATLLRSMISAVKVLFVPRSFRLGRESFCLCHGVFVCALRVLFVPWEFLFLPRHLWATI